MSDINLNEPLSWSITHIDLLSERYGGQALQFNDEFFAEANNLVKRAEPIYLDHEYTDRGKWMDGWETRRRRTEGYDWCILRMGVAGIIRAFDVNTTFFKGNAPNHISIDACFSATDPNEQTEWTTLVKSNKVKPHSHNYFEFTDERPWTHLRLNIYPDGGVARLRAYGEPHVDWSSLLPNELVDLAASTNGGRAVACSDMFFSPMNNIIAPGRGINMGDGWETRRRRTPGHDWLIVKLACLGHIKRILIDTCHFKGNFPHSFTLEGANIHTGITEFDDQACLGENVEWTPLIERTLLLAHSEHFFQSELINHQNTFTHVRLNIFPDGGVSRLRIFGLPVLNTHDESQNSENLQTQEDGTHLTNNKASNSIQREGS